MPFQQGQSGNPGGRKKDKPFTDALRLALLDHESEKPRNRTKLDAIAASLIAKALENDVPAVREIADRLEGKVPQAIVGDEDHPGVFDPLLAVLQAVDGKTRTITKE